MKSSLRCTECWKIPQKIVVLLILCFFSRGVDHVQHILASPHHSASAPYRLPGVVVPLLLSHAISSGVTSPSKVLQLSVHSALRNEALLDTLLTKQADPTSPLYHHYLTPQEFKSQFGPTENAVNGVKTFLQRHHLTVTSTSPNNLIIHTVGVVKEIETTFLIILHDYIIDGRTTYAPSLNPAVPVDLAPNLHNITGLDNLSSRTSPDIIYGSLFSYSPYHLYP